MHFFLRCRLIIGGGKKFKDILSLKSKFHIFNNFSRIHGDFSRTFQGLCEQCLTSMSALRQREALQDCCHAQEHNRVPLTRAWTQISQSKIYNVICLLNTQVQYSIRVTIYTYLHTSLALENVLVLITSGAIHAYVPAALIRVVVTISLASPKSVIFNTFSKLPSSILFRSKTEKKNYKFYSRL